MSLKDWTPPPFKPFATRHGGAIGHANERKMADAIGGMSSIRTAIRTNPDGSTTMLRTRNGFPEYTTVNAVRPPQAFSTTFLAVATMTAKFSELYMTSGAYSFGPLGGINISDPLLTTEPITYKSGTVAAVEAAELVQHYDKAPPANGEVSKIYNHTVSPGGINSPKAAMWNSRPSEFSGLMRRCMQGRYGAGNTSHDMTLPDVGGGISVGSTFERTTGILRFGTKYFLVAITSGGGGMYVYYYPLHFTSDVSGLMAGSYSEAVETLCLANAYVDPAEEVFMGNYDIAYGEPIAYGWIFSLSTNNATCVVNEMLAYGYDRRMYRLMSLSFSYTVNTGIVALTYTLDEEVDGWGVPMKGPIWSPLAGVTQWYNLRGTSPTPTTDQDFPVYAFYVGDDLKLVRWKWSSVTNPAFNQAEWNAMILAANFGASYYGEGGSSYKVEKSYGATITHGFSLNGSAVPSDTSDFRSHMRGIATTYNGTLLSTPANGYSVGFEDKGVYVRLLGDDTYNNHNPYVYPSGLTLGNYPANVSPGNHWSVSSVATYYITTTYETYQGATSHVSALVIPAMDCCAVYIGRNEFRTNGTTSKGVVTGVTCPGQAQEWYGDYVYNPTLNRAVWTLYGKWGMQVTRQANPDLIGMRPTGTGTVTGEHIIEDHHVYDISLHTNAVTTVGNVDSEVFYPGPERVALTSQVQVVSSSLNTDARYNIGSLGGTELAATNGYPTDITLFVGAS